MPTTASQAKNPWNGLRTYTEGEIIYGRGNEIQTLSLLILQSHQTVLYGRSGIGKSSILNAGIFPKVRKQGVFPVYIRLEHNVEVSYLDQIKKSIDREVVKSGHISVKEIVEKSDEESLWEFFHRIEYRNENGDLVKPLVVFDQFEEIFTLEADKRKVNHFFRQLADLINNVMPEALSAKTKIQASPKRASKHSDDEMQLDLGLAAFSTISYSYKTNSDFHLVFTIREDFLSYLERNTTDIPALKNNRFCLQPITREQALEIITKPRPEIVDAKVARVIVEKVSGESEGDYSSNQVDSAILSLYLSRLYNNMVAEGQEKLSVELVERYSADIIEDFYKDAISGISDKAIEWLENELINSDERRDSRDRSTVLHESGLSKEELNRLINQDKLLRQFSYGGGLRVEFIHDIIVPVVLKHKHNRETLKKQLRLKRRNYMLIACLGILLIFIGCLLFAYFSKTDKSETYTITLQEDKTTNLNEYWQAHLTVINDRDTLLQTTVDKENPTVALQVTDKNFKDPRFDVSFVVGNLKIDSISRLDNENKFNIKLGQVNNRKAITGKVMSNVGSKAPICNALVIIDDQVAKTNYKGEFIIYVDAGYKENMVRIIRRGYDMYEGPIKDSNKYRLNYNKKYTFYDEARQMEKYVDDSESVITLNGEIYSYLRGKIGKGQARMRLSVKGDSIHGYMYYLKPYNKAENKYNTFFLIRGILNKDHSFQMNMKDAVDNDEEFSGVIKNGEWSADRYYKKNKIAYYKFKQEKCE